MSSRSVSVSAPANILLLGEYAVLEEGGLGVTMAVERRVHAVLSQAEALRIEGSWGLGHTSWPTDGGSSLLGAVVAAAAAHLDCGTDSLAALPLRIDIDSSAFYDSSGAKLGLGSSAAVAATLGFALAVAVDAGADLLQPLRPTVDGPTRHLLLERSFQIALAAHRSFQGGAGSGYDVAASVYGGIGRFEGGEHPHMRQVACSWLPTALLFEGANPVGTPAAVARYASWKRADPIAAREFLRRSNECIEGFLGAEDWSGAKIWFRAARELGLSLGKEIDVPAEVVPPQPFQDSAAKAVGAGDELGIILADETELSGRPPSPGCLALPLANTGVRIDNGR